MSSLSDNSSSDGSAIGGGYSLRVGVGASHSLSSSLPLRLALDFTTIFPFAQTLEAGRSPEVTSNTIRQRGREMMLSEGLSYRLSRSWTVDGGLKQLWGGENCEDGVVELGTASRSFTSSIGVSYLPSRFWRLTGNYATSFPFYSYAANQAYAPSVMLAAAYAGL